MSNFSFPPEAAGGGVLANNGLVFTNTMTVPSVAPRINYYTPVGNWFYDHAGESTLEVDKGAGFVLQVYGVDYVHKGRGVGPPPTVLDAVIGFQYIAGPVPNGWTFRFTWKVRRIPMDPFAIGKARMSVAGVIDTAVNGKANGATPPNGVTVPSLVGPDGAYAVEFWRRTRKNSGTSNAIIRQGKRYLPYYRGAPGVFNFHIDVFSGTFAGYGTNRTFFKICYYDPTQGARSCLSNDVIVVNRRKDDRFLPFGVVRRVNSVWIQ
ncbi:MAG: hypothetical protein U0236_21305 [Nitrospira sp.]